MATIYYLMKVRLTADLSNSQKKRWDELKTILGTKNNAKTFKKLIDIIKL